MKFFPLAVVDDFFEHPDYVSDLARSVEYEEPDFTYHPGVTSKKKLHEIDKDLFQWTMERIISLYWDLKYTNVNWDCKMDFHKIEPYHDQDSILNRGAIHYDAESVVFAGVVYLNKDLSKDTGTSFYKKKEENQFYVTNDEYLKPLEKHHAGLDVEGIDRIYQKHYNMFNETARIQNQYNRLCSYSPEEWHGPTSYGDSTRYTLRLFVSFLHSSEHNYPLTRKV